MSFWQSWLAKKLIFENHPALDESRCRNTRQTKQSCTHCRTICSSGVFDSGTPDWNRCSNCGLCVAACPSRALTPSSIWTSDALDHYSQNADSITISCHAQRTAADWKLPCLAALPWELAALFALKGRVTLCTAACQNCETWNTEPPVCKEHIQQLFTTLETFLGSERFQQSVASDNTSSSRVRQFSRREAFSFFAVKSKTAAGSLMPDLDSIVPDGFFWRRLLADRAHTCTMLLPSFTQNCSACGRCTRLCPGDALHRVQDETNPSIWYMGLIPWRCTGCGLCETVCPYSGITAPHPAVQESIRKPVLHKIHAGVCNRCGEPVYPPDDSSLCTGCLAEQRTPIIWQIP